MKAQLKILLYTLLSLIVTTSCSDDEKSTPLFKVSAKEVNFNASEGTQTIHIVPLGEWNITSSVDWCKITPSSGNSNETSKIEIVVEKNTTNDTRSGTLTVTSGNSSEQITINQASKDLLAIKKEKYEIASQGQDITVEFQVNGKYTVNIKNNWITESVSKSVSDVSKTFVIAANAFPSVREGKIEITLGDITETVTIIQEGSSSNIPADKTGMDYNAIDLAKKLGLGWNLGNSLEACNTTSAGETMWGNPKTTQKLIDAVKAAGFNTIRIPCAWNGYIVNDETYEIDQTWLYRVKEVIDYCVSKDMYAIINIHWDGGWRDENPFYDKQEAILKKHIALWQQIAVSFRDYDEHLLFAGTNEVHAGYDAPTAENLEVQMSFNQSFVNTVRSTGGRNTWRNLIVQAYNTNIDWAVKYLKMPNDPTPDRIMSEVHFYDPWEFCGDENSNKFLWGKDFAGNANASKSGQEDSVDDAFAKMKTHFGDKGIPVILGEYGAILRTDLPDIPSQNHIKARNYYLNYVTSAAIKNGIVPIYWDNGYTGNNGFGLFDRNSGNQVHPDAIKAIVSAGN